MNAAARPVMVFHAPYPLNRQGTSASAIRPVRMRDAFESIGFEVVEVTGYSSERRRSIAALRKRIRAGMRVEFVYSESATIPVSLTDPDHLPRHPLMDLSFLRFCRRRGIPTGLFYRDVYWQFPEYLQSVVRPVALGMRAFFRWDLLRYRGALTQVFLPSERMARYLPSALRDRAAALPPASESVDSRAAEGEESPSRPLTLLFVGGLGAYYRMHEAVRGVEKSRSARLVLCTPATQWESVREEYEQVGLDRADVVHLSGARLQDTYAQIDLGSLFMEPIEYREFAAPLKMYEYLGNGKPIIATQGSLVARFVEENGVGWVLPYEATALAELLDQLSSNPAELENMRERVREVRADHTWLARARQVVETLTKR